METDRKKEVVNICLDVFIEKGLTATSTRELSRALKLRDAGLYYYFDSKDDVVIACAEEASIRLEVSLIPDALRNIENPSRMMKRLQHNAEQMAPTMRFLATVCASEQYRNKMKPVLKRLTERYEHYTEKIAETLSCNRDYIEPYVYMVITSVANYMIFSEDALVSPQMQLVKMVLRELLEKKKAI